MKKLLLFALLPMLFLLPGCGAPAVEPLEPAAYEDPPAEERGEALPIYIAWDGAGGEGWTYEFSAEGIVEEGSPPQPAEAGDGEVVLEDSDPPGGRTVWFRGVAPGDTVITFTTESGKGKVVDIQQYAVRVYDDLQLVLLHSEYNDFRG